MPLPTHASERDKEPSPYPSRAIRSTLPVRWSITMWARPPSHIIYLKERIAWNSIQKQVAPTNYASIALIQMVWDVPSKVISSMALVPTVSISMRKK